MSPYPTPVIVVPRKSKPGTPLIETKLLVIDYGELKKPKVQMTQAKLNGSLALIETAKIYDVWSKLRGEKYFTLLAIRPRYHHISIHPDLRPKMAFICPYGKFLWT